MRRWLLNSRDDVSNKLPAQLLSQHCELAAQLPGPLVKLARGNSRLRSSGVSKDDM
jgi:hypothetical protein